MGAAVSYILSRYILSVIERLLCFLCLIQEMLDSLTLHLEAKHTMDLSNLRSSLTLCFEEEVQKVRHQLICSAFY